MAPETIKFGEVIDGAYKLTELGKTAEQVVFVLFLTIKL